MRSTSLTSVRRVRALRLWACAAASLLALSACRYRAPETILIGALIPLTGASSAEGEYARNGAGLAVAEINAAGGVNGVPIRVVYEDSKSTVEDGVPAYQKLLSSDHVVATLALLNPVVVPAAPLSNRAESVLVNCGAQDARIRRDAGTFAFSLVPDAIDEAREMARVAVQQWHLTTAATLFLENDEGRVAAEAFAQTFAALGGRIVAQEQTDKNKDDMPASITRLRAAKPAAVYVSAPARHVVHALEQARTAGFATKWLTDSAFELDGVYRTAGPAAEGVVYTALRSLSLASPVAQAFATSYRTRFGFEPELRAASFYDGVFALKAAMDAAGGRSARDIARGMKRVARDGVTGRVDFTTSLTVSLPLELRTVTGGRPTVVPPR